MLGDTEASAASKWPFQLRLVCVLLLEQRKSHLQRQGQPVSLRWRMLRVLGAILSLLEPYPLPQPCLRLVFPW